jgi:WD repeat-containing protein 68
MNKVRLPWPAYASDCTGAAGGDGHQEEEELLAIASFTPSKRNELMLFRMTLDDDCNSTAVKPLSIDPIYYKMAATKAAFRPKVAGQDEILALSGSDVVLYRIGREPDRVEVLQVLASGGSLRRNSIASEGVVLPRSSGSLSSSSQSSFGGNSPPPITSLSWCQVDPSLLLTASYDTTCTVWNIETATIKTQLIAHDKEVFDVCFSPHRSDTFVSVGAEGSLRLFDTRYYNYI